MQEVRSWHQSLLHMRVALDDHEIPEDSGVSVELQIPQTSNRIDFILSGQADHEADHAVIVELKQWETAEPSAFLHNFLGRAPLDDPFYREWVTQAPIFVKGEADALRDFIKSQRVVGGRTASAHGPPTASRHVPARPPPPEPSA